MNVTPPAPAPAPPTATSGPPADATDARLAEAFASLVDMLASQLEVDGATGGPAEPAVDPGPLAGEDVGSAEGQDAAAADGSTVAVAPPVLLVWTPTPTPTPTQTPTPPAGLGGLGGLAADAMPDAATPRPASDPVPVAAGLLAVADLDGHVTTRETSGDGGEPAPVPLHDDAPIEATGDAPGTQDGDPGGVPADSRPDAPVAVAPTSVSETGDGTSSPVLDVGRAAPSRPTGEVAATTPAATTARTPAPSLPDQLVEVIGPLRQAPDGTHRMSVHLRPDELGEVLVDVRVRGNEINLSIRADLAGTADLLRDALGELRAELEAAGFRSGDVDVSSHPDRGPAEDRRAAPAADPSPSGSADRTDEGTQTPAPPVPTSGLDLRL